MHTEPLFLRLTRSALIRTRHQMQHRLLRSIERTPAPYKFALRNILFTAFAPLFKGTDIYTHWQAAQDYFDPKRLSDIELIDLQVIPTPKVLSNKRIAIQAHIFYTDIAPEIAQLLKDFPVPFDLLISTSDAKQESFLRAQFQNCPHLKQLHILVTPNRGRDLGPLLYGYGKKLLDYDYFAHIHTKKSSGTNDIGNIWRQYLFYGLLDPAKNRTLKILGLLEQFGLVYPQKFPHIDVQNCQWGDNLDGASSLCQSMGIASPSPGYIEFPAGSMFWAKTTALKPLLEHPFTLDHFEIENGQTDRTLMHAIERCLTHISLSQGYPVAVLRNPSILPVYP